MEGTIKTKLHAEYVLLESILDMVGHLGIVKDDKKLSALFCKLVKYVYTKLELPSDGDVIDMYFVAEQKCDADTPPSKTAEKRVKQGKRIFSSEFTTP